MKLCFCRVWPVAMHSSVQCRKKEHCAFSLPRTLFPLVMLLIGLTMGPAKLCGQVNTADVVGTVTDPSGAIIANAAVTIKNVDTGITRSANSNSKGEYLFTLLQVGTYQVSVEAQDFRKYQASSIKLSAGDRVRVDAVMKLGSTTETIAVSASNTPALDTDTSAIGDLIPSQTVEDMPLNGRNLTELVRLSAGITAVTVGNAVGFASRAEDSRSQTAYTANGQASNTNSNLLDGSDNNERLYGVIGVRPSMDAVQEVKVQTNLYTAEVGRTAGGAVDVITKSGTNKFHGSAFEYFRNNVLDSKTLANQKVPELRQNQFGGSLGGPILKGKTFFFGDYEGFRQVAGQSYTALVPTQRQRDGDFSELVTLGDECSSGGTSTCLLTTNPTLTGYTLDAVGKKLISLYPLPNVTTDWPTAINKTYNFSSIPNLTQFSGGYDVRIDHNFNPTNTLIAHYTINDIKTTTPSEFPGVSIDSMTIYSGGGQLANQRIQKLSADYLHIFRSDLLLQLKASYLRYVNNVGTINPKDASTALGFPCNDTSCINSTVGGADSGLPNIQNAGNLAYTGLGDLTSLPLHNTDNTFEYSGNLTWTHGRHAVKAGLSVIRRQVLYQQAGNGSMGIFSFDGSVTGNYLADILLGAATTEGRGTELVAQHLRTWEPSAYVQDDWRVNSRLTLNMGLRYDIFTPFTEIDGYMANFDPAKQLIVSPDLLGDQHTNKTDGINTTLTNFAPRLGFSATLGHGTVVRGGFGMTYFTAPSSVTVGNSPPFMANQDCGKANSHATAFCTGDFAYSLTANATALESAGFAMVSGYGQLYAGLATPSSAHSLALAEDQSSYGSLHLQALDMNSVTPYLEQWSLQVEKQMGGNVFTMGYVGNAGRHMMVSANINQPTTYTSDYPLTEIGSASVTMASSVGTTSYNAMQLVYSRRFAQGLTTNANYTWAHGLGLGDAGGVGLPTTMYCPRYGCQVDNPTTGTPTIVGPKYDWGNTSTDIRQRIGVMTSYRVPYGSSLKGIQGTVVKGWTVSGSGNWQTGVAITPLENTNFLGLHGIRPDRISNPRKAGNVTLPDGTSCSGPSKIGSKASDGKLYGFNPCAFYAPSNISTDTLGSEYFGNSHRNDVFGPHTWVMNAAAFKDFPIHENMSLSFRAESFNLTNTTNDASPGNSLGDTAFGVISRTASTGRQFQLALRLTF
jgi:hypothetical protein